MAEMIIQNPSITPNVFEYDEAGRVSAISGYPLAGGGGGTIVKSDLMWKPSVESDGFVHWTLASSATSPEAAYISGAQGPAGPQGVSGTPGKNPEFQINPTDAHWQWRYSGDTGWTDLGIVASGAVGPQGLSGNNGKDGISPKVRINLETNKWEISEDNGETWTSTNVSATGPAGKDGKDGASGTNGKDGISPTVSTETITGGSRVIFTYDDSGTTKTESIDVMSGVSGAPGVDGVSPTVTITDAPTATQHPQGGKTVTITDADHPTGQSFDIWNGINGEGATVNLLDGNGIHITNDGTNYTIAVSSNYSGAATAWVNNQHYLTDSDLNNYATKAYVEEASANAYDKAVAQIPTVTGFITKDVDNLTYYYKKTETSGANELATEFAKYALLANIPTKVTDLTDSANYVVTGNILTGIGNTLTGIKIGSTDYTVPTTDLSNYYTKSQTSANSELDAEFANKVDKPDTTQTSLNNKYLVYSTLSGVGAVTGWTDFNANVYSKRESDDRYQKKSDMGSYLTTAQYETDSATFVTSSNLVITGDAQYALTTSGWEKVQGGVSTVETNNYVSGDGTIQYPIGLSAEAASAIDAMSDQYQIDGGQYVSVVPNSTTHKVVVGLDNQATNAIADVIASANIWDKASAVSTKSHVTIDNTTNIITTENQGTSASLSAVEYKDNVNVAGMNIQQIYAVRNDGDIFACLSTTANKGTLFFVCSGV